MAENLDIALVIGLAAASFAWLFASVTGAALAGKSIARMAVTALFGQSLILAGLLFWDILENSK